LTSTLLRRSSSLIYYKMLDQQVAKGIEEGLTSFTAKYDLDTVVVEDLRAMLTNAMKTHIKPRPAVAGGAKSESKRTRRKTGYNLYIRAKFEEARNSQTDDPDAKTNSQVLMSSFSKEWKGLSEEDKMPYLNEAEAINAENGAETSTKGKGKGKKSLSGYNLYYSENKDTIRDGLVKDGDGLMKTVGATWKALSKEEQMDYNKRAAEISAERA
jgi:hypothetical protein